MKLHYINEKDIIKECKEKNIKQPNSAYRWIRRNPGKTVDDYIAFRKSKPNSNNYKICKDKKLNYNTVRQWINRKEGRTVEDFINRPPFLTELCRKNNINYKNAERWLYVHKDRKFEDYVKYLKDKAAKKRNIAKRKMASRESVWLRNHPEATKEDYIKYIKKRNKEL